MGIKANAAYDRAGFRTTKSLVDQLREAFGRSVPESLKGEPSSLRSDSIRPDRKRTGNPAKKK